MLAQGPFKPENKILLDDAGTICQVVRKWILSPQQTNKQTGIHWYLPLYTPENLTTNYTSCKFCQHLRIQTKMMCKSLMLNGHVFSGFCIDPSTIF